MSIPMIVFLSVLAFFVLLIVGVLLSPVWVRVKYENALTVTAGISFVRYNVYPDKEKKQKKRVVKDKPSNKKTKERHEQHKTADKKQNVDKSPKKSDKESISDTLSLVFDILKSIVEMFGKSAKINIKKLLCVVSKPDAADTAIYFGVCSGVVSTILALCSNFSKFKADNKNVGASMDFLSGKSKLEVDITISVSTIALIISLIKGFVTNSTRK